MRNSRSYRPYLLCMKIMVRRSEGIRNGIRMSQHEILTTVATANERGGERTIWS